MVFKRADRPHAGGARGVRQALSLTQEELTGSPRGSREQRVHAEGGRQTARLWGQVSCKSFSATTAFASCFLPSQGVVRMGKPLDSLLSEKGEALKAELGCASEVLPTCA